MIAEMLFAYLGGRRVFSVRWRGYYHRGYITRRDHDALLRDGWLA